MVEIEHNEAAWIKQAKAQLEVGPGPDQSSPAADEVVVKIAVIALNPSEWKLQEWGPDFIKYPHVFGSDGAGTVVKVGSGVTRFKVGDRVIGHGLGLSFGGPRYATFQNYTTFRERVTSAIPDSLSFEQASVLPLGISTGTCALHEILRLRLPNIKPKSSTDKEVVLIWGGASSMGTVGIQLAAAAGYYVVATGSAKNHTYIKSLVRTSDITVFDYNDPEVVEKVKSSIKSTGKFVGAYDTISTDNTMRACAEITHAFGGGKLATVLPVAEGLPEDVQAEMVYATKPGFEDGHIGAELWRDFIPESLKDGRLQAKPDPKIVGQGLGSLQAAMYMQKAGVSASKLVVTL